MARPIRPLVYDVGSHVEPFDPGTRCGSCHSLYDPDDPDASQTFCPPCNQGADPSGPVDEVASQVYSGSLAFVPLTGPQLAMLMEAVGSLAGRLVDEDPDPRAYVPWANLQGYLGRFAKAVQKPPVHLGLSNNEAEAILARLLGRLQ